MPGVHRHPRDRGKRNAPWRYWFRGADGRRHYATGTASKDETLRIARKREDEATAIREGLVDPGERTQRQSSLRPIGDHIEEYRLELLARGDTKKHANHTAGVLRRLLESAAITSVADIPPDRVQAALGRMKAARSARTCNHAIQAVKAFAIWLHVNGRIRDLPRAILKLRPYNQKADRRLIRRALTRDELARLLAAAEAGPELEVGHGPRDQLRRAGSRAFLSGPERALLYRLAMGTGFRANELRSLTPECFDLNGTDPAITCKASYTKNGREARQPITRELAAELRPLIAGKPAGKPVLFVPAKTAKLLQRDLAAAGIPAVDERGRVLDFHALRHSYITHLIESGANPKIVQTLARHSTITLTLDTYTHLDESDTRKALERT